MIYVGIDISKLNHFASVVLSDGEVLVEPFQFSNDLEGFRSLFGLPQQECKNDISFIMDHVPGLEGQADWMGDHGHFIDLDTGEIIEVHSSI